MYFRLFFYFCFSLSLAGCSLQKDSPTLVNENTNSKGPQSNQNNYPIEATFDSINTYVFQISCQKCHNPTGHAKRVLLDKDSLLNSPLELIIPGDPDESGLVIAIERTDRKRMPPADHGYSALSDHIKVVIRKWIENGAKD